jgi:hypothetical protein
MLCHSLFLIAMRILLTAGSVTAEPNGLHRGTVPANHPSDLTVPHSTGNRLLEALGVTNHINSRHANQTQRMMHVINC